VEIPLAVKTVDEKRKNTFSLTTAIKVLSLLPGTKIWEVLWLVEAKGESLRVNR
jgi:hypothetical protein